MYFDGNFGPKLFHDPCINFWKWAFWAFWGIFENDPNFLHSEIRLEKVQRFPYRGRGNRRLAQSFLFGISRDWGVGLSSELVRSKGMRFWGALGCAWGVVQALAHMCTRLKKSHFLVFFENSSNTFFQALCLVGANTVRWPNLVCRVVLGLKGHFLAHFDTIWHLVCFWANFEKVEILVILVIFRPICLVGPIFRRSHNPIQRWFRQMWRFGRTKLAN